MQYADILRQANLHRGQSLDPSVGNYFLNEGMEALANQYDSACLRKTATLACTAGVWTNLPTGILRLKSVVESGTGVTYDSYEASIMQIKTDTDVILDIEYLTRCPDLVGATGTPEIHDSYHRPLALFMAARDRQRTMADEDGDSARLMSEFGQAAHIANARLSNLKGTKRTMKVGRFR